MTIKNSFKQLPDDKGYFGAFGGRYVSETLMPLILEVEKEYEKNCHTGGHCRFILGFFIF